MEPNLDRAVIALDPATMPRFSDFERDILRPADLLEGDSLGIVQVQQWSSIGDLHKMAVAFSDHPRDFAVLVNPRDVQADTFLRTRLWNVSYTGKDFDRTCEALLREVAKRLDLVAERAGMSPEQLHERYFRRPRPDEYLEVTPGKKLYLRVTDHCDENCIFCNATEGNQNIVNSKAALRRILDGLPAGELLQVIFSGGEPTLVKALPAYVQMAYEAGARDIIVQTNGHLLDNEEALQPYLPFADRLGLGFSLHAFDEPLSDLMTGVWDVPKLPLAARFVDDVASPPPSLADLSEQPSGRLARKLKAIDLAVNAGFRVKIAGVVRRPNLAQVPAFAQQCWARWGARLERLQFSYAMPRGNAWLHKDKVLRFAECKAPFAEAFELGRRTGLRVETSQSCCVPPCVMPDYVDHVDVYGDFGGGKTSGAERAKPASKCGECQWDRICAGVWRRYLDTFGDGELQTITDRPLPSGPVEDFVEGRVLDLRVGGGG